MDESVESDLLPAPRIVELLARSPLFQGLACDEVERIASGTVPVRAVNGQVLFRRGDPCAGFHLVVFGQVKLAVGSASGGEKVMEIVGPGRTIGEAVLFTGRPHLLTATALADSLLLHVDKERLFLELDRDPLLSRRMLAGLSMRLHTRMKDVEAMTLHSATQRVTCYLLRLSDEGATRRVTLPAQKSLIASRLNVTPEYFSRILHGLAARNVLRVEGREIVILDPLQLRGGGGVDGLVTPRDDGP